jgi:RNA polymerase sigma factor (sigma-70 family)
VTRGALRRVLSVVRRQVDPDASGPLADERLLARFAKNGDPSAFELLVWRHGAMVLGVCRRVLGDHHLAEDAFQATFLALARKPKAVRSGAALAGWLHRVARRIAVRARVDGHKRAERDRRAARSELVHPPDVLSAEAQAVIDDEIDRLPEWQRRAVVLCYLDGHTAEQAAQMLGCPRGTVLSRLAAARARLHGRLTRRGLAIPAGTLALGVCGSEASAALVSATAKVVLGGGASVHVIGWANGVLYAMFLNKIKLATATVLTAGMLGTGVGWVAVPGGHGSGLVGDVQADDRVAQEQEEAKRQRDQAEQARTDADRRRALALRDQARAGVAQAQGNLDRVHAELKAAEAQLAAATAQLKQFEDQQTTAKGTDRRNPEIEAAEAKMAAAAARFKRTEALAKGNLANQADLESAFADLKEAEARLAAAKTAARSKDDTIVLERQLRDLLAQQQDLEKARTGEVIQFRTRLAQEEERLKALDREQTIEVERLLRSLTDGRNEMDKHRQLLAGLVESRGADHPDIVKLKTMLADGAKNLDQVQKELAERQERGLRERLKARELMVRLEEEAKLLERQRALAEQEWAANRAALQDRMRQAAGGGSPASADQRLNDIERKLDTLARELADLRREIKK